MLKLPDSLHLDFESRSVVDLRKTGVYVYAEHPSTDILCFSYRIGVLGKVKRWKRGQPIPQEVIDHVAAGFKVVAHNAMFERVMWNKCLRRRYPGLPEMQIEQMSCTLVRAYACNLPGRLDKLAAVLGLNNQKLDDSAMRVLSRPRPKKRRGRVRANTPEPPPEPTTFIEEDEAPELYEQLYTYCDGDVMAECEADNYLPELIDSERELWFIDQRMNDRGVKVDEAFIQVAVRLTEYAKQQADLEIQRLTLGEVSAVSKPIEIKAWLEKRGIVTETLRKGDFDDLLIEADSIKDATARQVLELRRNASKSSTAKYEAMLHTLGSDGRIRGLLQFCGATQTLRWAGRLVQPQNYPRVDADTEADQVAFTVNVCKQWPDNVDHVFGLLELIGAPRNAIGERQDGMSTLAWLSKALRSTIIACEGHRLLGGDFSNIEGRVNAWLAGEFWKLEAFRAYDAGTGPDLYKLAYSRSFNIAVEIVTKLQRQIGKVEELALGYQGGVGAFTTMTQTYLLKLAHIVRAIQETLSPQQWDSIAARYNKATDKWGLDETTWTAIKSIVIAWRGTNEAIVQGWWDLQDAAIAAVDAPHTPIPVYGGRGRYMSDGNILYFAGPTGEVIWYANPQIVRVVNESIEMPDGRWYTREELPEFDFWADQGCKVERRERNSVRVWREDDRSMWSPLHLYGGFQCENIVQFVSRCALKRASMRCERAGYPLVLTVHDELVAEAPTWFGSAHAFKNLMTVDDAEFEGCPIVAATWEDTRYVK
jgi:DNA polymerase